MNVRLTAEDATLALYALILTDPTSVILALMDTLLMLISLRVKVQIIFLYGNITALIL